MICRKFASLLFLLASTTRYLSVLSVFPRQDVSLSCLSFHDKMSLCFVCLSTTRCLSVLSVFPRQDVSLSCLSFHDKMSLCLVCLSTTRCLSVLSVCLFPPSLPPSSSFSLACSPSLSLSLFVCLSMQPQRVLIHFSRAALLSKQSPQLFLVLKSL
jgi:hypothetical protein